MNFISLYHISQYIKADKNMFNFHEPMPIKKT